MKFEALEKFLLHLHPRKVSVQSIKFNRTFGLGGINALLFVLLSVSGIMLRFSYVPTVEGAYDSIVYLQDEVLFGKFLRNIHHFAAHLMVITSFLHLIRVYYSHSLYKKRAKNWIYGIVLFFTVLFFNFTGYLLPWDQLAYWAVTVITQVVEYIPFIGNTLAEIIRGGDAINGHTLLNFYNLHTSVLPILMIVLMSLHFWLIRMAGGVATPKDSPKEMVETRKSLVPREALVAIATLAFILIISAIFNAPLEEQANPAVSPNPNKAPWYFLGAQELLLHLTPLFSAFIIPLIVTVFFIALPYLRYTNTNSGVWFHSTIGKILTIESAFFSFLYTFALILLSDFIIKPSFTAIPIWLSGVIMPIILYIIPFGIYLLYKKKKHHLQLIELTQIIVTIILCSYVVMMLVSLFLRGEGMTLFNF